MRYKVIHIILPTMISLACAASCSSDPLNSGKGEEFRFEVADGSTRATTITTASNLTDQPFMLFGDVYRNGEFHSGLRTIFEKAEVTYIGTDSTGIWDYGSKQYWHMGQEHSFVAIHPYDIPGISDLTYEGSKVSFTYAMPKQEVTELESAVKDIIVATHRRKYNLDNSGPVQFNFQHLLTRINVAPALNQKDHMYPADDESKTDIEFGYGLIKNEFIQIRKVELSGFYTTANVSITPASLSGNQTQADDSDVTINVDKSSAKATISVEIAADKSPHIFNDTKNVSVFDNTAAIMMIPQTFEADAQIKLEYTVNTDNTRPEELRYVIVPLNSTTLERGKSYTMKFTIEDVYKGQIANSSLEWEVDDNDIPDPEIKFNWIDNETGTIRQEFEVESDPSDSENNNDNEDEE